MIGSIISSILCMLATLAISYGIDQWIYNQQRMARQTASFTGAEIWLIVGGLVLVFFWLALAWLILYKSRRHTAVSVIYIVVGLLAFLWLPLELVSVFWITHFYLFPNYVYNLQYTGLFVAVLGILTLLIPKTNPA